MGILDLDALVALEQRGWDALCGSRGGTFYGDLMTPEAVMILVDGTVLDRPTIAATLDGAPAWASYELTDTRLVPAGDAVALVYRASARRPGEAPFTALMASTYVEVEGRARLALYQQTTVTH
jgi:hypothetical protein